MSGEGEEGFPPVDLCDTMFDSWSSVAKEVEPSQPVMQSEVRQNTPPVKLSEIISPDQCELSPDMESTQSVVTNEQKQEPVVDTGCQTAITPKECMRPRWQPGGCTAVTV